MNHTTLTVYEASGREVTRLIDGVHDGGYHTVEWTDRKNEGRPARSGVYFYSLKYGDICNTRKMLLLKGH